MRALSIALFLLSCPAFANGNSEQEALALAVWHMTAAYQCGTVIGDASLSEEANAQSIETLVAGGYDEGEAEGLVTTMLRAIKAQPIGDAITADICPNLMRSIQINLPAAIERIRALAVE